MLRKIKCSTWLILIAIVMAAVIISNIFPHERVCYKNEYSGERECTNYTVLIGLIIKAWVFCDIHAGGIQAIAGALVAWFTLTLRNASIEQGRQTERSINLARDEFIATHRPRLRVRNFELHETKQVHGPDIAVLAHSTLIRGQLRVSNVGDSNAFIYETFAKAYILDGGLPMRRPYEAEIGVVWADKTPFRAGISIPLPFDSFPEVPGTEVYDIIREMGPYRVFVMGYISYRDAIGTPRRTSFCRRYDAEAKGFRIITNPDYEHEE